MSFITRCPSCDTTFKVVPDQLRISEGWVRCGRCQEVFDASQALEALPVTTAGETADAQAGAQQLAEPQAAAATDASQLPPPATEADADVQSQMHQPPSESLAEVAAAAVPPTDSLEAPVQGYELPAPPELDDIEELGPWLHEDQAPQEPDKLAQTASLVDAPLEVAVEPDSQTVEPVAAAAHESDGDDDAEPAWHDEPVESEARPDNSGPDSEHLQLGDAPLSSMSEIPQTPVSSSAAEAMLQPEAERQAVEDAESVAPATAEHDLLPEAHVIAPSLALPANEEPVSAPPSPGMPSEEVPSFVKQAQRKAWWNQPAVRFVMGMLVILLPLALLLQVAVHERNTLVAWKPQWRGAFENLCIALRCELAPRQHIASVTLTGSAFNQDGADHHYRLSLSLRNASVAAVATPAVELTLTDAQDQVLVRKVLMPSDIGAPMELAPRAEWSGDVPVATQKLHLAVAGYRVMAFYP